MLHIYKRLSSDMLLNQTLETAARTVVFVAPSAALPDLVSSIKAGLDPSTLGNLSKEDLLVWESPEGTLFHDGELAVTHIRSYD